MSFADNIHIALQRHAVLASCTGWLNSVNVAELHAYTSCASVTLHTHFS